MSFFFFFNITAFLCPIHMIYLGTYLYLRTGVVCRGCSCWPTDIAAPVARNTKVLVLSSAVTSSSPYLSLLTCLPAQFQPSSQMAWLSVLTGLKTPSSEPQGTGTLPSTLFQTCQSSSISSLFLLHPPGSKKMPGLQVYESSWSIMRASRCPRTLEDQDRLEEADHAERAVSLGTLRTYLTNETSGLPSGICDKRE